MISVDSFRWVSDVVRTRSAIILDSGKEYLVESRLAPLARDGGFSDVDAFVRSLRASASFSAVERVVDALTTNETSWFRDAQPFKLLSDVAVPDIMRARPSSVLNVWSAACSSGQEAYSVAMELEDLTRMGRLKIFGSDINQAMVDRARAGRYSQLEVNRGVPAPLLVKHFKRSGVDWEVSPLLKSVTSFSRHNLLDAAPGGPFDVVFLRNVLIYFDLDTKRKVLSRVRNAMRPDGFLFLGAAETTIGIDDSFERVGNSRGSIYRPISRRGA